MAEIIHKKRGRKPKNYTIINQQIENENKIIESINTDEEKIIFHLPITINEINDFDNYDTVDNSLFIKSDKEIKIQTCNNIVNDTDSTESLRTPINNSICDKVSINTVQKISTHNLHFTQNTKCWWCRNGFNTPCLELPEDYYNDTFFCIGNFCSYNCAKAYNIDINDNNIWKRESLINLMYYMTYNRFKNIEPSPSWLILKEFGGFMSINDFRKNFETNNSEYILLYPPLISRQMQIEESYKKTNTTGPINKLDKLFFPENNYLLKRSKPIETSQLNLEKTMGLKRK